MYHITPETAADRWEVEALYDTCFAPGREALSSYRLRDGVPPVAGLNHVARDAGGILAGAIRYWPVCIATHPALLLGPVAVHPTRQGEGLGALLIEGSLADAPYYNRFGFSLLSEVVMPPPTNPERVLGRALVEGAWEGISGDVTAWPH